MASDAELPPALTTVGIPVAGVVLVEHDLAALITPPSKFLCQRLYLIGCHVRENGYLGQDLGVCHLAGLRTMRLGAGLLCVV